MNAPKKIESNPGNGFKIELGFEDTDEVEVFDLVEGLEYVFRQNGEHVVNRTSFIEHVETGFLFSPAFVEIGQSPDRSFSSATTIQVNHPQLIPHGVFEYQHTNGDSIAEALNEALYSWYQCDLPVFLDMRQKEPQYCSAWSVQYDAPPRTRRALLGPLMMMRADHDAPLPVEKSGHETCPCCMFTAVIEKFDHAVKSADVQCVRLFAFKDDRGETSVDCRINGEEYDDGKLALAKYAKEWTGGPQFRKQYVILHDV
jgi:hypothetical protein